MIGVSYATMKYNGTSELVGKEIKECREPKWLRFLVEQGNACHLNRILSYDHSSRLHVIGVWDLSLRLCAMTGHLKLSPLKPLTCDWFTGFLLGLCVMIVKAINQGRSWKTRNEPLFYHDRLTYNFKHVYNMSFWYRRYKKNMRGKRKIDTGQHKASEVAIQHNTYENFWLGVLM